MDIYLDIDGVLLQKDGRPANGLDEFLDFTVSHFECYWLTTHCKGTNASALHYLRGRVSDKSFSEIGLIHATDWQTYKTEAINFNKDFLWLDDLIFEKEKKTLAENNVTEKLVIMDLKTNPNQLLNVLQNLKEYFKSEMS